jgi:glycosyltransferase involved in cell wall biosynthesis
LEKVGLDATYSMGTELSGVGLYSREILWGVAEAHPEAAFEFWYRAHRYWRARSEKLPRNVRRRLLAEPLGPRSAAVFHGLNQRLPRVRMRRAVATFHDLFVMTGEYSTPEFRARFTEQARDAARRADAIIAVSEFTKGQVVALLGVEAERVRVVHHGVRRPSIPTGLEREDVVLSVGAIQTRKNSARLVKAFERVTPAWRLVLAGAAGFGAGETMEAIAQSPARDRIVVTGYVTNEELAAWYGRASIFAFPSLDEGFGMPVLEAMTAGVPVITSNRSAMPEVAGDAALLVDPEDTEAISGALCALAADEHRRAELARLGTERAQEFTWEKAVRETWALYQALSG